MCYIFLLMVSCVWIATTAKVYGLRLGHTELKISKDSDDWLKYLDEPQRTSPTVQEDFNKTGNTAKVTSVGTNEYLPLYSGSNNSDVEIISLEVLRSVKNHGLRVLPKEDCVLIRLQKNEYQLHQDYLRTVYSPRFFNKSEYVLHDDHASICYPTDPQFSKCARWRINGDEYTVDQNRTLLYKPHNESYPLGRYILAKDVSFVCIPKVIVPPVAWMDLIYVVAWVSSDVALLLTILVKTCTPFRMGTKDEKPLICHMVCLFAFYLMYIIFQLGGKLSSNTTACYFMAITIQYSLRAAFCWLNVIAYDTWRKFHPKRLLLRRRLSSMTTGNRFLYRSLYAWGVAFVTGLAPVLTRFVNAPIVHGYGKERCLLLMYSNVVQVALYYGLFALIVLGNVVLFVLTVINLRKIRKDVQIAGILENNEMLRTYLKLMAVTGVGWIFQVVEWIVMPQYPQPLYWIASDLFNSSQGVILFMVYCCNSFVFKRLRRTVSQFSSTISDK